MIKLNNQPARKDQIADIIEQLDEMAAQGNVPNVDTAIDRMRRLIDDGVSRENAEFTVSHMFRLPSALLAKAFDNSRDETLKQALEAVGLSSAPRHGSRADRAVFKLSTMEIVHPFPYLEASRAWLLINAMREECETPECVFDKPQQSGMTLEQREQWIAHVAPTIGGVYELRTAYISTGHLTQGTAAALDGAEDGHAWLSQHEGGFTVRVDCIDQEFIDEWCALADDDRVLDNLLIMAKAGFNFIRFDCSADQVSGLNVWGW